LFFQEKKTTLSQRLRLVAICFLFGFCTAHLVRPRALVDVTC
jgi:hypothetical protein